MKIVIDEDIVATTSTPDGVKLTLPEVLACVLTQLSENGHDVISNLESRGILIHEDSLLYHRIRPFKKYKDLVHQILLRSDQTLPKESELIPLAQALKDIYPKGRKTGSITWQDSLTATVDRLRELYKKFPEIKGYSHEQIIQATQMYVDLFKSDNTLMRTLNYFLWKKGDSISSDLIKMLENPDSTMPDFYDSAELV